MARFRFNEVTIQQNLINLYESVKSVTSEVLVDCSAITAHSVKLN